MRKLAMIVVGVMLLAVQLSVMMRGMSMSAAQTNPASKEYMQEMDGMRDFESGGPSDKPYGLYEFALNGPDKTLIRVGWPTRLRKRPDRSSIIRRLAC